MDIHPCIQGEMALERFFLSIPTIPYIMVTHATDLYQVDVFIIMLVCTFLGIELFAYKVLDNVELKRGIQSLRRVVTIILLDVNKVNWLETCDYTCSQGKHTMHWIIKEKKEINGNSEGREKLSKDIIFLEAWEPQFPSPFVVKSFEPRGT